MKLLVTSASGANGDGYGQLLAFSMDGTAQGAFSNDSRIVDPRGLRVNANQQLLYVNSGDDRILALDSRGDVQYDTCHIPGLNAGGGNLGPDRATTSDCGRMGPSPHSRPILMASARPYCSAASCRFRAASRSPMMARYFSRRAPDRMDGAEMRFCGSRSAAHSAKARSPPTTQ